MLASHLEWRLAEARGDGFDLTPTGDDNADRAALVAWLLQAAHAGPYLAPSWGRSFSESIAWIVENDLPFSASSMVISLRGRDDPEFTRFVHEHGVEAAEARHAGWEREVGTEAKAPPPFLTRRGTAGKPAPRSRPAPGD